MRIRSDFDVVGVDAEKTRDVETLDRPQFPEGPADWSTKIDLVEKEMTSRHEVVVKATEDLAQQVQNFVKFEKQREGEVKQLTKQVEAIQARVGTWRHPKEGSGVGSATTLLFTSASGGDLKGISQMSLSLGQDYQSSECSPRGTGGKRDR